MSVQKTAETPLQIEAIPLKKAALVIRAVNHRFRQQILQLLHEKRRLTVTEIYTTFGIDQPVASQQLAILRSARFVTTNRRGKYIYYEINYTRLEEAQEIMCGLLEAKRPPATTSKQSGVSATAMLQPV